MDFDGYALGGLSVGEPKAMTYETVSLMGGSLPNDKPRYLMGAGSPEDLVTCIGLGMDMFDCSLPTRVARNGGLFTADGRVNVHSAPYRESDGPIDDGCDCYACESFSAAYLHHLFRARELLAYRLASVHNLRFVTRLMEEARAAIVEGAVCRFPRCLPRPLPRHGRGCQADAEGEMAPAKVRGAWCPLTPASVCWGRL